MSMARVSAVLVGTVTSVLGFAGPAVAGTPETWTEPEPRPILETLGIFVGLPLGLFVLIALACLASSSRRGPRYRPDQEWWAEPEWFAAPATGNTGTTGTKGELVSAPAGEPGMNEHGGTTETKGELVSAPAGESGAEEPGTNTERGGASARW